MLFVILLSVLVILLFCKWVWAFELSQQHELASKFESNLQDNVVWGRKLLDNFKTGKF